MIGKLTDDNTAVQKVSEHNGIGVLTSATLIAEIIDIRRFAKNDNLASYAGLARREYKTGDSDREIANHFFNPRLKHAFMTAAKNFVIFNPDSHLSGYYNNLIKGGMKRTDARKRVARALVRVFFRDLCSIATVDVLDIIDIEKEGDEHDMANGKSRSDKDHSNISHPSRTMNNTLCETEIKEAKQDLKADEKEEMIKGKPSNP